MNKAKIVACLKSARLFRVLPKTERDALADGASVVTMDADTTVFFRGDAPDHVYLVLEGSVAVESMSNQGKTIAITSLGVGEVFGEMAVLDDRERSANIRTLEPSSFLLIGKTKFRALLRDSADFSFEVVQDLVGRLRQADDQLEAIMFLPLKRRLADLLLRLFQAQGRELKITQADLAYRLTATREKVNVNLQILQDAGAIRLARGRVTLVDENVLKRVK